MNDEINPEIEQEASPEQDTFVATEAEISQGGVAMSEAEILREELSRLQAQLASLEQEAKTQQEKFLRARADLDNYRRRAAQDTQRARESGADSMLIPMLEAYDDLSRALSTGVDDPSQLIPGLESVKANILRKLDLLGIKAVGSVGEPFDPDFHEALSTMPSEDRAQAGTIATVFQAGFAKDDRLIRPARVVVYQD
jgi:molecular chaperone GrpE